MDAASEAIVTKKAHLGLDRWDGSSQHLINRVWLPLHDGYSWPMLRRFDYVRRCCDDQGYYRTLGLG